MDFADTSRLLVEQAADDIAERGVHLFADPVDPGAASELLADIRAVRRFDASLFLSEDAFDAGPRHAVVEPRPGRNLLDRFEDRLGFVEDAPQIVSALCALLGPGYRVLDRKVVCGLPARAVPSWLKRRLEGRPADHLGPYVRPSARDVTYLHGLDPRRDLIDGRDRGTDVLTLHVALHPVGAQDAPPHLLEGTHRAGAPAGPHAPRRTGPDRHRNGPAGEAEVRRRVLTGETGSAALWHAGALHGAQAGGGDRERISLRYLFAPGPGRSGRIREINAGLEGPLGLHPAHPYADTAAAA